MKAQNSFGPRITKGIAKSSKKKQKLYEKYSKNRNPQNLATYKRYKNLFETIKRKSKKNYYSEKILSFKDDAKKTENYERFNREDYNEQIIVATKNKS